jgi:hypothetical protein
MPRGGPRQGAGRPKSPIIKRAVAIWFEPKDFDQLEAKAKLENTTRSGLAREMILAGLAEDEHG